jgi:demethylmenaquinone methyltransferase/2-methoxy-6-polyprenyl-1,4-benzoquinol methylase
LPPFEKGRAGGISDARSAILVPKSSLMPSFPESRIHFFEKIASYYDLSIDILTFGMYARFLRKAVEVLDPKAGEKILDLCSGTGRAASWITHAVGKDGEVVGMDIAKEMVGVSNDRYGMLGKLTFLQKDVTEPWDYRNYFDGILNTFSLHELPEPERLGVLEKSYFALKEKSRMVIADFNPQASGWRKTVLLAFFKLFEEENLNFFSVDQKEMLRKAGFKTVRTSSVLSGLFEITVADKS